MAPAKIRVILSRRRPIEIDVANWRKLAEILGCSESTGVTSRLCVRQRDGGRTLVYGYSKPPQGSSGPEWHGGELLDEGSDTHAIEAAIRQVGAEGNMDERIVEAAIQKVRASGD